jgi:hypothetical protein
MLHYHPKLDFIYNNGPLALDAEAALKRERESLYVIDTTWSTV